jgi:hypothetical protein
MKEYSTEVFVGIDVFRAKNAIAVADAGRGDAAPLRLELSLQDGKRSRTPTFP